jgi:hypothetical protein
MPNRLLKKSVHGLFQLASARSKAAPHSKNQTLGVFDFRCGASCGARQLVFRPAAKGMTTAEGNGIIRKYP